MVGRAGRGGSAGRAVIQTYTPENDVIQCAARQDYQGFYEREIRMRRLRRFPPFADLFTFTVSGTEEGAVLRAAVAVREELRRLCALPELAAGEPEVLGPAPAPVMKLNNRGELAAEGICKRPRQPRDESICGLQLHGVSSVLKEVKDLWLYGRSWCRERSA